MDNPPHAKSIFYTYIYVGTSTRTLSTSQVPRLLGVDQYCTIRLEKIGKGTTRLAKIGQGITTIKRSRVKAH